MTLLIHVHLPAGLAGTHGKTKSSVVAVRITARAPT
jgi:hypothetical protein